MGFSKTEAACDSFGQTGWSVLKTMGRDRTGNIGMYNSRGAPVKKSMRLGWQ